MKTYECEVTTGPNFIGYYCFKVTVIAEDDEQAERLAARKGQQQLGWDSPLKVNYVKRVTR